MQLGKVTGPLQCQLAQKPREHLKFINPFFFFQGCKLLSKRKKKIREERAVLWVLGTTMSQWQRHLPTPKKYCHFHFHGFLLPFTFWYWPHSQPSPESLNSVPGSCNVLVCVCIKDFWLPWMSVSGLGIHELWLAYQSLEVTGNSIFHGNLKFVCEKSVHFGVWAFCFNRTSRFSAELTFYFKGGKGKSILLTQKHFQTFKRNSKQSANNTSVGSGIIENSTGANQVKPV